MSRKRPGGSPGLFCACWKLLRGEAVEQAGAARGLELVLATAARAVRRVPRLHVARVLQALQVVVADDRRAVAALGPVAAGGVAAGGGVQAHRVGAGEDVVLVRRVAAALDRVALLVQRRLLADVALAGMQLADVTRHHHALGVVPGALADALARVDAGVAARQRGAEVRLPVRLLRARGLGERAAVRVSAFQAAEVGAVALAGAGDEE